MLRNIKKGLKNMPELNDKPIIIGCGGYARSGKDTFVKISKKVLRDNGYTCVKLAFADALKEEIDPFLIEHYGISAWTDDTEEKSIIRPYLVAHGCGKRMVSKGRYWIDKIDQAIEAIHFTEDVIFISDCRFENEADWIHQKWGGWFAHVKKYSIKPFVETLSHQARETYLLSGYGQEVENEPTKVYDQAPNEEEAVQDPLCEAKADYKLELENVMEKTLRETGIKIKAEDLVNNSYLLNEITTCLTKCPFLTILRP